MMSKQKQRASSIDETNIVEYRNKGEQQQSDSMPQQPTDPLADPAASHFVRHHKTDQT
jgi:hypothetical protein